jgi:hypothetical protein
MSIDCTARICRAPAWMSRVLSAAGIYHLAFAVWANAWPHLWFDWAGLEQPNFPWLWRSVGMISALFGVGFLIAARQPIRHWLIVLIGWAKMSLVVAGLAIAVAAGQLPAPACWIAVIDDLVWWLPFAWILWAALQAHAGRPPLREHPLTPAEAAAEYRLSSGETLAEAAQGRTIALVFLRHFGCTFTRQLLRGLEQLEAETNRRGARLVLVHMLQHGRETTYLGARDQVARIADPMCELYRAFGLGKGGFFALFGLRVWWKGLLAVLHGCGVGHLAGDGLQMPGAFLFRDGRVVARQPARSAADLPDLDALFEGLPVPAEPARMPA